MAEPLKPRLGSAAQLKKFKCLRSVPKINLDGSALGFGAERYRWLRSRILKNRFTFPPEAEKNFRSFPPGTGGKVEVTLLRTP